MADEKWDLIIAGAGAAGLAAGIYGARSGLKTLLLEEKISGGTAFEAPLVENYPGFLSIRGSDLADKMGEHCRKSGAVIRELEAVQSLKIKDSTKTVTTSARSYEAKAVILAMGSHYREICVPGEREFRGRGVSYCGVCDGPLFKGKHVLVVGGGNSALTTALYLSGLASEVSIVHRRNKFRAEEALVKDVTSRKNMRVFWGTEVKEIKGEKVVSKVGVFEVSTGQHKELDVSAVFVQAGEIPNSQLAVDSGVEADDCMFIKTDVYQRTNIAGVYAAGDITNHPVKQVGTAVGQGITAALEAYAYIRQPYYRK
jgi:thioredoxin reductase (NADPH)